MTDLYAYALPAGALLLGTLAFVWTRIQSRAFDRRYGKDSDRPQHAMRAD